MYRLKNTSLILLLIILVSGSCKNLFKKDLSLTVKEYAAKGMPRIDTVWGENELIKAHVTLGNVRTKSFQSLPGKDSRKSGAVFNRILSRENLLFLNDTTTALHDMAYRIQTLGSFLNDIGRMYTDNLKPEQYYHEELIEIFIFQILVREKMLELAERIMNSKDPEDISMGRGRQSIINGYVNLIMTLIRDQEKTKAFNKKELKRLNSAVTHSIKQNIKELDPQSKKNISNEIKSITDKFPSSFLVKDFEDVLKDLKD